jgi:mono/diheme cytochrome c family protein
VELPTLVVALVLAAIGGARTFGALALAYVMAWAMVEVAARTRVGSGLLRPAREQRALLVLSALVPAWVVAGRMDALVEAEGLRELSPRLADRMRLASEVAIAPPLVAGDRPQDFFVRIEGATAIAVRFGRRGDAIAGEDLGHGVFRVRLDPREHTIAPPRRGRVEVVVEAVDRGGEALHEVHAESLALVTPRAHPRRARARADGEWVCVTSEETDELGLGTAGALARSATCDGPVGCAFVGEGALVACRYGDGLEVHGPEGTRGVVRVGRGAVALDAVGERAVVVRDGEVRELVWVDVVRGVIAARVPLEGVPLSVVLATAGRAIVATRSPSTLVVIDLEGAPRVVARRALAMPAPVLAVTPDARSVVIGTTDFREDAGENLGNHFVEDQLVWLRLPDLDVERVMPTARRTARQDHAGDADRGLSPAALAFDQEGALLVAFAGSHELARVPRDGPPRYIDLSEVTVVPSAVAATRDGVVVAAAAGGAVLSFDRTLALRNIDRWAPDDATLLREDPEALRLRLGERTFWEGTRAGASCQSCHTEGGSDGEAHNIGGRVLAPTLDVRGLAGTAPFLRDGSYPYLGDLHEVAVLEYRGYRTSAGDRRATLDAWLASLPLPPSEGPRELARERRGLDAFFAAGCERCHAPPAFTALARYPALAVFPDARIDDPSVSFDVPALRSLRGSAPYLFDGRAATLDDVLGSANRENRHGDTRGLSPEQRADLVFFLETL